MTEPQPALCYIAVIFLFVQTVQFMIIWSLWSQSELGVSAVSSLYRIIGPRGSFWHDSPHLSRPGTSTGWPQIDWLLKDRVSCQRTSRQGAEYAHRPSGKFTCYVCGVSRLGRPWMYWQKTLPKKLKNKTLLVQYKTNQTHLISTALFWKMSC